MIWIKAFHIVFMVTWFAGLFYLPRLFVYHALCEDNLGHARFVVMERKLFIIMTVGAVLTTIFGVILISNYQTMPLWLQIKLGLVALLIAYHLLCFKIMKTFKQQENSHSHVFYRWFNEAPVLLLIGIVLLAVVKPY